MGPLFLSWTRPSREQQKAVVGNCGDFNYNPKLHGASDFPAEDDLRSQGFHINRHRVLLGSGHDVFCRAEAALRSWRHFKLNWAFVDPETPVEKGAKFCVCVREILPWLMMPLQVAYVRDIQGHEVSTSKLNKASFRFGSGTLQGHLLAGEERFSVEWDNNDQVWYGIFSFSKPAHILALVGYPYVLLRQRTFTRMLSEAILKHVADQELS